ncbi:hypothetical protein SLS53_009196 [Cytospora paraplurivora]|uniref:Uncharacterized protein n=1 Tax=Cytospora paraplurivora TaxID=2898453 RepID=A0AAN9YC13_9PEZI
MSQSPGPPARPATPTPTPTPTSTPNSDAVKAACEAALADFLTKVEAGIKAGIKQELSESTNENLNEYIGALQVQLSNQTPPQTATSQNPSLRNAMSEIVKLHLAFQLQCATRAAEREKEEAKMRVEDIYSSGSMRNLYRSEQPLQEEKEKDKTEEEGKEDKRNTYDPLTSNTSALQITDSSDQNRGGTNNGKGKEMESTTLISQMMTEKDNTDKEDERNTYNPPTSNMFALNFMNSMVLSRGGSNKGKGKEPEPPTESSQVMPQAASDHRHINDTHAKHAEVALALQTVKSPLHVHTRKHRRILPELDDGSEQFRYALIEWKWARRWMKLQSNGFLLPERTTGGGEEDLAGLEEEQERYVAWLKSKGEQDKEDQNPVPQWVREEERERARRMGLPEPEYETQVRGGMDNVANGFGPWEKKHGRWGRVLVDGAWRPGRGGVFG